MYCMYVFPVKYIPFFSSILRTAHPTGMKLGMDIPYKFCIRVLSWGSFNYTCAFVLIGCMLCSRGVAFSWY